MANYSLAPGLGGLLLQGYIQGHQDKRERLRQAAADALQRKQAAIQEEEARARIANFLADNQRLQKQQEEAALAASYKQIGQPDWSPQSSIEFAARMAQMNAGKAVTPEMVRDTFARLGKTQPGPTQVTGNMNAATGVMPLAGVPGAPPAFLPTTQGPSTPSWTPVAQDTEKALLLAGAKKETDAQNRVLRAMTTGGRDFGVSTAQGLEADAPGITEWAQSLPETLAERRISDASRERDVRSKRDARDFAWKQYVFALQTQNKNAIARWSQIAKSAQIQLDAATQGVDIPGLPVANLEDAQDFAATGMNPQDALDALYGFTGEIGQSPAMQAQSAPVQRQQVTPQVTVEPGGVMPVIPAMSGVGIPQGTPPNYQQSGNTFSGLATQKRQEAQTNLGIKQARERRDKEMFELRKEGVKLANDIKGVDYIIKKGKLTGVVTTDDAIRLRNLQQRADKLRVIYTADMAKILNDAGVESVADLPAPDQATYQSYAASADVQAGVSQWITDSLSGLRVTNAEARRTTGTRSIGEIVGEYGAALAQGGSQGTQGTQVARPAGRTGTFKQPKAAWVESKFKQYGKTVRDADMAVALKREFPDTKDAMSIVRNVRKGIGF